MSEHYHEQRWQEYTKHSGNNPSAITLAIDILAKEEGFVPTAYYCSEEYPTIGYGQKIGHRYQSLKDFEHIELPEPVALAWLVETVLERVKKFDRYPNITGTFMGIDANRQAVLISMAYQLGAYGLSQFKQTLTALYNGDYEEAAKQALDSRWAAQTPERAKRHAHTLRTGELI